MLERMTPLLTVAGFGVLGVLSRYACHLLASRYFAAEFPWMTLTINVTGSFLIGAVAGFPSASSAWKTGVAVGFLGGFTTFSAFSLEVVRLVESTRILTAALYLAGSPLLGVLAAWGGLVLARYFFAAETVMK